MYKIRIFVSVRVTAIGCWWGDIIPTPNPIKCEGGMGLGSIYKYSVVVASQRITHWRTNVPLRQAAFDWKEHLSKRKKNLYKNYRHPRRWQWCWSTFSTDNWHQILPPWNQLHVQGDSMATKSISWYRKYIPQRTCTNVNLDIWVFPILNFNFI